jgi:hypothetical protein
MVMVDVAVGMGVEACICVVVAVEVGIGVSVMVGEGRAVAVGAVVGVVGTCAGAQAVRMRTVIRVKIRDTQVFISASFEKTEALYSDVDRLFFTNPVIT